MQFSRFETQIANFLLKENLTSKWINKKENESKKNFNRNDLDEESLKILCNYYKEDFELIN